MDTFEIDIPNNIQLALDKLQAAGYEAYVVGGCVRDAILGREPQDWDITTSASPKEIQKIFRGYRQKDTGLKHGTIMVILRGELIEITTYRIDHEYSDGRRPDNVSFTGDITEDLRRRDFTINACAANQDYLIDPFGCREDIDKGLISCVGNPIDRFTEDALRILRGIRFASVLNFRVEGRTKAAMFQCKDLLKNISQERISTEFYKTLLGSNVYNTLIEFEDIILDIVPEIKDMIGFEQHNKHHIYDVYGHSLKAVEAIEKDKILRLTMLFHDTGKPSSFTLDQEGIGHFYGHSEQSAYIANKILKRMRFPNKDIYAITQLVKYHNRDIGLTSKSVRRILNKLGETQLRRLLKVKRADTMAKNPILIDDRLEELKAIEEILDQLLASEGRISLADLKVNGYDLMELGVPEGEQIGLILNELLNMVLNEEIENSRDRLLKRAESLI